MVVCMQQRDACVVIRGRNEPIHPHFRPRHDGKTPVHEEEVVLSGSELGHCTSKRSMEHIRVGQRCLNYFHTDAGVGYKDASSPTQPLKRSKKPNDGHWPILAQYFRKVSLKRAINARVRQFYVVDTVEHAVFLHNIRVQGICSDFLDDSVAATRRVSIVRGLKKIGFCRAARTRERNIHARGAALLFG